MSSALFYLSTILIWGSTWFAITLQLGVVPESVSLVYRFGLAAALLLAVCLLLHKRMRFSFAAHGWMAAQGICLFSVNYLLFYWCTHYITSGLVAVIFSTVVIMNIFNGALFLKTPVRPIVLLGAILGLVGLTLVFGDELLAAGKASAAASSRVLHGLGIGLVATYCASLGNILSARNQKAGLPVLQTNAFGMAYGSLVMLLFAMLSGASFTFEATWTYSLSLVYLSVFGSIIAFGAYLSLIGRIGADRAAYATVVFPLVALVISSVFEDYVWSSGVLVGVALVLFGNLLVVGRSLLAGLMVPFGRKPRLS